jgi:hypothetical protein
VLVLELLRPVKEGRRAAARRRRRGKAKAAVLVLELLPVEEQARLIMTPSSRPRLPCWRLSCSQATRRAAHDAAVVLCCFSVALLLRGGAVLAVLRGGAVVSPSCDDGL